MADTVATTFIPTLTANANADLPLSQDEKINMVKSWIGKVMRVKLTDNRAFVGRFVCVDNEKNVILHDTKEYIPIENTKNEDLKITGLVMLPGKHIVSIWLEQYQDM